MGWEGSATDAHIYDDVQAHDLHIPAGKYYLADAGFLLCDELLMPYQKLKHMLSSCRMGPCKCQVGLSLFFKELLH